jgi:uncharacterized glyoxalase superfamily protein PhnB
MPKNPPDDTPRISPYLYYEDAARAIDWLVRAFGLRERMRIAGPDGAVQHAELECADGLVMLGCPGPDYRNPKRLGQTTQSLYVYVDDVDKHFRNAKGPARRSSRSPRTSSTATAATAARIRKGTTGSSRSTSATSRPRT